MIACIIALVTLELSFSSVLTMCFHKPLQWAHVIFHWSHFSSVHYRVVRFPNCIVYYQSRGWGPWLISTQTLVLWDPERKFDIFGGFTGFYIYLFCALSQSCWCEQGSWATKEGQLDPRIIFVKAASKRNGLEGNVKQDLMTAQENISFNVIIRILVLLFWFNQNLNQNNQNNILIIIILIFLVKFYKTWPSFPVF